jgi:hypothetical protein
MAVMVAVMVMYGVVEQVEVDIMVEAVETGQPNTEKKVEVEVEAAIVVGQV